SFIEQKFISINQFKILGKQQKNAKRHRNPTDEKMKNSNCSAIEVQRPLHAELTSTERTAYNLHRLMTKIKPYCQRFTQLYDYNLKNARSGEEEADAFKKNKWD